MPTTMAGQTFLQQGAMPAGTVTGAWGGTQATTSNPATNRAIYVLSAVITLAVIVLVVLQFVPVGRNAKSVANASASPSASPSPSPSPLTVLTTKTDPQPSVVTSATASAAPSASTLPAVDLAPSATTKKKTVVGDPFGTQRR
jgi:hypothetical protein